MAAANKLQPRAGLANSLFEPYKIPTGNSNTCVYVIDGHAKAAKV